MNLLDALRSTFPATQPNDQLRSISSALSLAINSHIVSTFVPAGFGSTFLSAVPAPTPAVVAISTQLEVGVSPVIAAAITALTNPATPAPAAAWMAVNSILLTIPPPAILAGPDGARLWSTILLVIISAVPSIPVS